MIDYGGGESGPIPITERKQRQRDFDHVAFKRGLKRVIQLEALADAEGAERALVRWHPGVFVRWRTVGGIGGRVEIFAGWDAREVAEAARLAGVIEFASDEEAIATATIELGELLGYPSCCARAFAADGLRRPNAREWLQVRRRLEAPERVDARFNPGLVSYVPCSLSCAATRDLVRHTTMAHQRAPLTTWAVMPTLLLLDRPGELMALRPLEPVTASFRYELAFCRTSDPRQAAVASGERLVVEPGVLIVESGGRETARFAGEAFLWWWEDVFHRHWWQARVEEQWRSARPRASSSPAAEPGGGEPTSTTPER